MNKCKDCHKILTHNTTIRCRKCYIIYKKTNSNKCIDCEKSIRKSTKRCWDCYVKEKIKNRTYCKICKKRLNNHNSKYCKNCYIALIKKPHYCNICKKRLFSYYATTCQKCYNSNRKKKISYCIKCGKGLSVNTAKRCKKCFMKYKTKLQKGRKLSEKHKINIGKSSRKNWKNKTFREKTIKATFKAIKLSPNKPEQLLNRILKILFKKNYKFVGNGKIIIDGFNPDFIHKKDKKIIELYGDYWHNKPSYIERDKRRAKSYKKAGYKLLIIWEHELQNLDKLAGKLLFF